ncbi:MAG: hypothetical protein ACM3QS_08950 [Bacteroidota bacterium]
MHRQPSPRALFAILVLISLACQLPAQFTIPRPTPTPAAPGSLLFEDDFSTHSLAWDSHSTAEGVIDYDAGGYRMLVNGKDALFWSTPHRELRDVRLEVDEGKLAGPDENRVGLFCRYAGDRFYFFIISHDGYYGVGMFSGGQDQAGQMELIGQSEMQYSPVINRGTNVNHLRADCAGDTLTLYVNGEKLAQAQDSRLSSGDVGLLGGTFSEPGADIIFDNFVALQP